MPEISIATWNLHQAVDKRPANMEATWRYLETELHPDVALIQEAHSIPMAEPDRSQASQSGAGYSTAVISYGRRLEPVPELVTRYSRKHAFVVQPRVPGSFAIAQLADPPDGVPFVAVSLYGIMAPLYAQTGVLRAVADLIPLFDAPGLNRRIVLGGDLNAYDQTRDRVMRDRWKAILALVESLGLVNLMKLTRGDRDRLVDCPCRDPECWHAETFRHVSRKGAPGFMTTDYLFATKELTSRLTQFQVVNRAEVWELSDHCPLVARFAL